MFVGRQTHLLARSLSLAEELLIIETWDYPFIETKPGLAEVLK